MEATEQKKMFERIGKEEVMKEIILGIITEEELLVKKSSAPLEKIVKSAEERYGFTRDDTLELIKNMARVGKIFEPELNRYAVV